MATRDSTQVQRLRAAGAIVVGKTNTPEFGFTAITKNLVYGVTRSPWNLERTPGGSSGGSAAALAGSVLPLVTASDGGGSIRIPASFTGAFGLKPSFGRIPLGPADHWGYADTAVYGPLTKTVEDAALFLDQVVGPSPHDPNSLPHPGLSYLEAVRTPLNGKLRIGFSPDLGYAVVQSDVAAAVEAGVKSARVARPPLDALPDGPPMIGPEWGVLGSFELASQLHPWLPAREPDFGRAFLASMRAGWSMTPELWGEGARLRAELNDVVCARLRTLRSAPHADRTLRSAAGARAVSRGDGGPAADCAQRRVVHDPLQFVLASGRDGARRAARGPGCRSACSSSARDTATIWCCKRHAPSSASARGIPTGLRTRRCSARGPRRRAVVRASPGCGRVHVGIAGEQRPLEEQHARRPDRGRRAERRQDELAEQRLDHEARSADESVNARANSQVSSATLHRGRVPPVGSIALHHPVFARLVTTSCGSRHGPLMLRSESRILTTHAGSLPRPQALVEMFARLSRREPVDAAALRRAIEESTRRVIDRQLAAGIDVGNDGEQPRESFFTYVQHRMSGFGGQSQRPIMRDIVEYPSFAEMKLRDLSRTMVNLLAAPKAVAEVRHLDRGPIDAECAEFLRLLRGAPRQFSEAFTTAASPGIIASAMLNEHYASYRDYVMAVAEALRVEYAAIASHGLVLQIDCPDLAMERHTSYADRPLAEFLDYVELNIAAINHALGD